MKGQGCLGVFNLGCWWPVCAGLLALFSVPAGTAYAQTVGVDVTGSVTCDVVAVGDDPLQNTMTTVIYEVQADFDSNLVIGRWGEGRDVYYIGATGIIDLSKKYPRLTFYFYKVSDPDNYQTFEQLYSETGVWEIRIGKDNQMTVTGQSFAVVDSQSMSVPAAECTWNLQGTAPEWLSDIPTTSP